MDKVGISPLTVAVEHNKLEIIKVLLDKGADPTRIDATGKSPLYTAIKRSKLEALKLFLQRINIQRVPIENEYTPLIAAIISNSSLEIIECLLQNGVDINRGTLRTPLAWAALQGHLHIVKFLVEHGADINRISATGNTAVATVANCDKVEMEVAKYLVSQHADLEAFKRGPGINGRRPLYWAIIFEHLELVRLFLDNGAVLSDDDFVNAIQSKQVPIVKLMIEKGARVTRSEDPSPLQTAVDAESYEMTELLIDHGAKVVEGLHFTEVDDLWILVEEDNYPLVCLLVAYGARLNERRTTDGETLLTKCLLEQEYQWAYNFINLGADVNTPNSRGLTPLAIARRTRAYHMVQILREKGAYVGEAEE